MLAAFCVPLSAQAQGAADAARVIEEGLRRQEERSREPLQPWPAPRPVPRPSRAGTPADADRALAPLPAGSVCFPIAELTLSGPDAAHFAWLLSPPLDALDPPGRCLGAEELTALASELDQRLLSAGYITTRAALPAQNLASGRLQVRIEAGRVADIQMHDADAGVDGADSRWGTWRNAFPTAPGALLNLQDLEQGIDNMRRLPSQEVGIQLEPGLQPGTSVLRIARRTPGERMRGSIGLDNGGGATLGRTQLSANLAFDNPLGLYDIVSASAGTNAEHLGRTHRSQSLALQYSLPWGYHLFSLAATHSRFAQYAQGTTARFLFSGESRGLSAGWQRTVWRSASGRFDLHAGLSTRRASSHIDDTEILVQRRRTTNLEFGIGGQRFVGGTALAFELHRRRGVGWFSAEPDLEDAQAGGPTLRPRIWRLSLSAQDDFTWGGRRWRLHAALRAQHTRDATLPTDQIAIGGRGTVRGFDGDTVLLAESGWVLRSELSTPLLAQAQGADLLAVAALDHGRVWGPAAVSLPGHTLTGAALGLRGRRGGAWFEALLGLPLHQPEGFPSRSRTLVLSLTQTF
ncbi:ShlB/FhaC/HecB family hemolysin secretion/activation protein [Ramlibacter rhizophilus]|uniref:ShlB/FhaC/HecB family hemolysin secretion/activation protein n=1 Tax=Ramlibacter rhizophilus TaxID=1781167 RepID=A0A4Z0BGH4_9BURK|nr:ShlB/FhaC/HecB family hemolysin secretion/activation protein [Ramlibacter rhizophilus]